MAREKKEKEEKIIYPKTIKANCSKCNAVKKMVIPYIASGFGGIRCNSCGVFDNFYCEYKDNDEVFSLISVEHYYKDFLDLKKPNIARFVLKCKKAKEITNFFKENKFTVYEANNTFIELGIDFCSKKKVYPIHSSEFETEEQLKNEAKLKKELKKILKSE